MLLTPENFSAQEVNLSQRELFSVDEILSLYVYGQRPSEVVSLISSIIQDYSDESSRINIAKAIALKDGRRTTEYFDLFDIKDQSAKIEIATITAFTHARRTSKHIGLFNIPDETTRQHIATCSAFVNGRSVLEFFGNFEVQDPEYIRPIVATALLNNPGAIEFLHRVAPAGVLKPIDQMTEPLEMVKLLTNVSQAIPDILPPTIVTLYDDMKRRDAGIKLAAGYILGGEKVTNPREALHLLTQFSTEPIGNLELSSNAIGDLYETLLDLQSKYFAPFFSRIDVDDSLFDSKESFKNLQEFINSCNILSQARGIHSYHQYDELIDKLMSSLTQYSSLKICRIDASNIKDAINHIQDTALTEIIGCISSVSDSEFGRDKILELESHWGDINAFATLVARYSGKEEWNSALSVLVKVAELSLEKKLLEYKYYGEKNNQEDSEKLNAQIGFLSPEQLDSWTKNPSNLDLIEYTTESVISQEELDITVRQLYDQLLNNIGDYQFHDIPDFLELNDKQLTRRLKELHADNPNHMLLGCIGILESRKTSLVEVKKIISRIKSLKDILRPDDLTRDTLYGLSERMFVKDQKKEILFTTFFDDPKLTISVGNLIRTTSCFNYNNGTEVQALMAATVDANIKGVASFMITASDFSSFSEFQTLAKLMKSQNEDLSYNFNPTSRILQISTSDRTFTIQLNNAFYRMMVKLGRTPEGEPGLRQETPHTQEHRMKELIKQKANELFLRKAIEIGAQTDKAIFMPESRSAAGSYSEVTDPKGRKTGSYIIPAGEP